MATEIHEKDLGKGIDQRNSENQLNPGFWEILVNAATDGNLVKKRQGYQQLGGYLPFRVQSLEYTGFELCFNLDTYVDLSRVRSSPIVVRGTSYEGGNAPGDFAAYTFTERYYNEFVVSVRRSGTSFTIPQPAHGHNSWIQHSNIYVSDSLADLSNELIIPDTLTIVGPGDLTATTELTQTDITVNQSNNYVHASIDASELGPNNYYPNTAGSPDFTSYANGTTPLTFSFDAVGVGLLSANLLITVYERANSTPTQVEKIVPDDITINGTDVTITLNPRGADFADYEYFYVATAVPDSNVIAGQVTPGSQTVIIPNVTPFTSFAVYTLDGNVREYVIPDSAVFDDTTDELTITFQTNEAVNYQIYYTEESLRVNQLCVTADNSSPTASTSSVELDLYGLDPLEVMTEENRNHWLTHIDTYRSSEVSELLTGVAGNLYKLDSTVLESTFPRYRQTLGIAQYLTPYFQDTGTNFTAGFVGRGYITCGDGSSGPTLTTIEYQSGTGYTRFTLSTPSVSTTNIALGSGPSEYVDNLDGTFTSTLEEDVITVEQAGYSIMNGEHLIKSVIIDTNNDLTYVDCEVSNVTNSDFDEVDVGGYAQIYTTPLTIDSATQLSNTIGPGVSISVGSQTYSVRGNQTDGIEKLLLADVTQSVELSSGLFILGTATTDVVPVRDFDRVVTTGEYVKGDMVQYTDLVRFTRIKDLIQLDSQVVSVLDNEVTFTTAGDALNFQAGQRIALITDGLEGGTYTVLDITSDTTLTLDNTFTATSARFIGKTIEIDESLQVVDTVSSTQRFSPTGRWHSLQKPSLSFGELTESATVQYPFNTFETTEQAFIRSTMASDNMYFTNGEDPVLKYDGANLTRAGLSRWEGLTFVRIADDAGAIVNTAASASGTTIAGSKVFTTDDAVLFTAGQIVSLNTTGTVTVVSVDVANSKVVVDTPLDAADTTMSESSTLKYYARLNLVDGNNNIIGSAATGVNNQYTVDMGGNNVTVGLKLAKPPILPLLDYDRLEYEIYRTKQDGAVFFKVATLPMDFTGSKSYVYFEDTVQDSELTEPDILSTSTVGAEVATGIEAPLRAKYVTSANNRLILGNVKDSPRIDVQIFRPTTELTDSELNGLTFSFTKGATTVDYKFLDELGDTVTAIALNGDITWTGTNLVPNRWCYLYKLLDSAGTAEGLGWFLAADTDQLVYSGPLLTGLTDVRIIQATADNEIPILAGEEFSDGDAGYQDGGNQLKIQTKLINAINATQFELNSLNLSGEGRADAAELGRFSISTLDDTDFNLTITHTGTPDLFDVASVFINNTKVLSGETINSTSQNYASRMLVSFPNFPEIFDRPRATIPQDSLSVIDVNSADGQEITGIIPFFGESTSQDSRKQDIVICFKENSIYAVNVTTRSITKIDSRGVGCNAPGSIAVVPNGIIFAARSGVYRINRSFDVIWVGRYLDRVWNENTNLSQLALATGHVYPQEKEYRLSVAAGSSEAASEVYVYDYGDEQAGQVGGWLTFNNIPSTGWASDGTESYFGSTKGRMYQIRNTGLDQDYRDDDQPVEFTGTYRAMDFGAPGKRKIVRAIVSHFRVLKMDSNTIMEVGVDLTTEFTPTTRFTLTDDVEDGLSTVISSKIKSIRQNLPLQKGVYFQLKYTNSTIDTPLALAGVTFHVVGLDYAGITQASET